MVSKANHILLIATWMRIPETGFEVLPNVFWSWAERDAARIRSWTSAASRAHTAVWGGNPALMLPSNLPAAAELISRADRLVSGAPVVALYTHQAEPSVSAMLLEAIRTSPQEWRWLIRFHPQYPDVIGDVLRVLDAAGVSSRVEISETGALPLPLLLARSTVHITEFSSSVIEAEALGVPSIVLSPVGVRAFNTQVLAGTATAPTTATEMRDAISAAVTGLFGPPFHESR